MNINNKNNYIKLFLCVFLSLPTQATAQPRGLVREVMVSAAQQSSTLAVARCAQQNPQKLAGVVVALHGRGGHASTADLAQMFLKFACPRSFAVVAPRAPTKNHNWPFEKMEGEKQDLFLIELIKKTIPKELESKEELKIYLVGVSAGATFLMGDFYPRHGAQLKGVAAALCGGSAPTTAKIQGLSTLEKNFPLFIQMSRKDFLFQQTEQGLKKYAEMGLPLRARLTEEPGHCAFDFADSLELIEKQVR
ncbi:MAG: hypothetical protein FJY29_04500 [Betaproteobacteria bacterium]|nr:hypothetical protein [Betaproteobacteria bacterium]